MLYVSEHCFRMGRGLHRDPVLHVLRVQTLRRPLPLLAPDGHQPGLRAARPHRHPDHHGADNTRGNQDTQTNNKTHEKTNEFSIAN